MSTALPTDEDGINAGIAPACLRCRHHKLKCSRERPVCARCARAHQACSYAAPPDRRRMAARRAEERRSRRGLSQDLQPASQRSNVKTDIQRIAAHPHQSKPPRTAQTSIADTSFTSNQDREDSAQPPPAGVSREVAVMLVEIYFQRHYQATFLLDKQRFLDDYFASSEPSFLTLAVFAYASLFIDMSGQTCSAATHITIADLHQTDWAAVGQTWAEIASQKALAHADTPYLAHVQALQTTGLFWFAKSQIARAEMHYNTSRLPADTALQCAYMLGYDTITAANAVPSLAQEDERRVLCFWACWITQCSNHAKGAPYSCWNSVVGLPVPVGSDIATPRVDGTVSFDGKGNLHHTSPATSIGRYDSAVSFLLAFGLWSDVRQFATYVVETDFQDANGWMPQLWALDERLECLQDNLPDAIRCAAHDDEDDAALKDAFKNNLQIFNLGYVCHMLFCFLHSTMVPALSANAAAYGLPRHLARTSVKQVIRHSSAMTTMATALLSKHHDLSQLWPAVGYAAHLCATIQTRCLQTTASLGTRFLQHTEPHLAMCRALQKYWSPIRSLYDSLDQELTKARDSQIDMRDAVSPNDQVRLSGADVDKYVAELLDTASFSRVPAKSRSIYINLLATRKHHNATPSRNYTGRSDNSPSKCWPQDGLDNDGSAQGSNDHAQAAAAFTSNTASALESGQLVFEEASIGDVDGLTAGFSAPADAANPQVLVWDDCFFGDSLFSL